MLGSFNIEQVVQSDCYNWYQALVLVLGRIQKRLLMFINLLQDGTYPSRD
jgi:hypothetical protein